jgi:polyhydroxyalkanoate synthesis regulator phasin
VSEGNVFDRLKAKGEEVFTQISAELMNNPGFVKAMQGAMEGAARGRETLDRGVAKALKSMSVPTRADVKKMNARIESLESELSALKARARAKAGPARKRPRKAAAK